MVGSAVLGSLLGGGFLARMLLSGMEAQVERQMAKKYASRGGADRLQAQINVNERRIDSHEERLREKDRRLTKLEEADRLSWSRAVDQLEKMSTRMDEIATMMGEQSTSQRTISHSLTSLAGTVSKLESRLERLERRRDTRRD